MLKEFSPESLKGKSLRELNELKTAYGNQKERLEIYKQSNDDWNNQSQELLDNTALFMVDIEDAIEELTLNNHESDFKVPSGQETHIHLLIHYGNSYSPITGQLISEKRVQSFNYSEWTFFKKSFMRLGYTIDKVLHDPYGEASKYIKII